MKSISTINPAITENEERSIVELCTPTNYRSVKSGSVTRLWCITTLCFQLLQTLLATFQAKNNE